MAPLAPIEKRGLRVAERPPEPPPEPPTNPAPAQQVDARRENLTDHLRAETTWCHIRASHLVPPNPIPGRCV